MSGQGGVSPDPNAASGQLRAEDAIAQALDYALGEHGLDDMGLSTSWTAGVVLEDLAEAGYAVVQLPEPDEDDPKCFSYARHYVFADDDGEIYGKYGTEYGTPEQTRAFAAVLLAASLAVSGDKK